jgi:hypothetical protein
VRHGSPRSEHHLVITRSGAPTGTTPESSDGQPTVLLLEVGSGWALPRIELRESRSSDVTEINRAAAGLLGVEVSVLCCLSDEPGRDGRPRQHVHAVDTHGAQWSPPLAGRWITREELDWSAFTRPDHGPLVGRWLGGLRRKPLGECDWLLPGWRRHVVAWVDRELARRDEGPVVQIDQVRVWEFSQVLRMRTAKAELYFKARPRSGRAEPPLTRRLAEDHPESLPAVLAVEADRGWMLMRAVRGSELTEVDEIARWEQAAATIARIQLDWVGRGRELTALGCPHRSIDGLVAQIAPLLEDRAAMQPRDAEALTDIEATELRRRRPDFEALGTELAGYAVPESLEHGDLWASHVIVSDGRPVFIDWEDASLSHPFFTPALLLLSLDYTEALARVPDARRRIQAAYLAAWRERGPLAGWPQSHLDQAFQVALRVALLHYAIQFRRDALARIETSWEVRAFVPLFLRALLRASDGRPEP